MTTAPYLPESAAMVTGSHEQRVTLELTDGTTTWAAPLLAGDITLAEDWSPRAQFSAVIPNTFTPETLASIDPRTGTARATVTAGYVHPDGTVDMHPLFTGHLRERVAKRPGNEVQIQADSDEALTQDAAWMATDQFKSFAGVTEALEYFASYATGAAVTITSSVGAGYRPDLTSSIPVKAGGSVWEFMSDLALAANIRLFVDSTGAWQITAKATAADEDNINNLTVSDSEDVLSRNGYYSAAVLKYEWTDALGNDHTVIGRYGTLPGKVYYLELDTATTQAAADTAAQDAIRNLSTRGDSFVCTSVAAYWLRPGDTVRVSLANGTDVLHIVRQVVFHLTNSTMTVTTREPSNLGD